MMHIAIRGFVIMRINKLHVSGIVRRRAISWREEKKRGCPCCTKPSSPYHVKRLHAHFWPYFWLVALYSHTHASEYPKVKSVSWYHPQRCFLIHRPCLPMSVPSALHWLLSCSCCCLMLLLLPAATTRPARSWRGGVARRVYSTTYSYWVVFTSFCVQRKSYQSIHKEM